MMTTSAATPRIPLVNVVAISAAIESIAAPAAFKKSNPVAVDRIQASVTHIALPMAIALLRPIAGIIPIAMFARSLFET